MLLLLRQLAHRFAYINWALADQAIVSGTSFATTILVARFLGMEEFGRFALAWLGIFFSQNLQIALVTAPMMTIARKHAARERPAYTGAVLLQQAVFVLITTILVFTGAKTAQLVRPEWQLGQLAIPLCALVLCGQGADFIRRYFFTFDQARVSFSVDLIRYGTQIMLLLVLFMFFGAQASVSAVLYAMSVAALLALGAGTIFFGPVRFESSSIGQVAKRHWSFSRWLVPSAVANWCRENFVHTAVAAVLGLSELGALRAAQQLVRMVNVLIQAFDNVVPMRAGAAFAGNGFSGLVDFVDGFVLRYTAAITAVLVAIAALGGILLTLFYGPEYTGYGNLVAAYAAVIFLYLIRNLLATMMRAMETTIFEFYASVSGAIFVTVCSLPLVTEFGMAGALIALALFEGIMILLLSFGLGRKHVAGM